LGYCQRRNKDTNAVTIECRKRNKGGRDTAAQYVKREEATWEKVRGYKV